MHKHRSKVDPTDCDDQADLPQRVSDEPTEPAWRLQAQARLRPQGGHAKSVALQDSLRFWLLRVPGLGSPALPQQAGKAVAGAVLLVHDLHVAVVRRKVEEAAAAFRRPTQADGGVPLVLIRGHRVVVHGELLAKLHRARGAKRDTEAACLPYDERVAVRRAAVRQARAHVGSPAGVDIHEAPAFRIIFRPFQQDVVKIRKLRLHAQRRLCGRDAICLFPPTPARKGLAEVKVHQRMRLQPLGIRHHNAGSLRVDLEVVKPHLLHRAKKLLRGHSKLHGSLKAALRGTQKALEGIPNVACHFRWLRVDRWEQHELDKVFSVCRGKGQRIGRGLEDRSAGRLRVSSSSPAQSADASPEAWGDPFRGLDIRALGTLPCSMEPGAIKDNSMFRRLTGRCAGTGAFAEGAFACHLEHRFVQATLSVEHSVDDAIAQGIQKVSDADLPNRIVVRYRRIGVIVARHPFLLEFVVVEVVGSSAEARHLGLAQSFDSLSFTIREHRRRYVVQDLFVLTMWKGLPPPPSGEKALAVDSLEGDLPALIKEAQELGLGLLRSSAEHLATLRHGLFGFARNRALFVVVRISVALVAAQRGQGLLEDTAEGLLHVWPADAQGDQAQIRLLEEALQQAVLMERHNVRKFDRRALLVRNSLSLHPIRAI
eukprot:scaffold2968_cov321-Pinguiococcus_pyrenoidosus.AAC.7